MNRFTNRDSERGAALVMAIISLLIMSGLAAAMLTSARTESLISLNKERGDQARMAAEAGLNHGSQVAVNYIRNWQTNGFASAQAAMTRLLRGPDNLIGTGNDADNGSLESLGLIRPPTMMSSTWTATSAVSLHAATNSRYHVRVFDEDDPNRGLTLITADVTRLGEDGVATNDSNKRVLVQATGFANGSTRFTLEAVLGPLILPAIVTNGDLAISGNPTVSGANGSVHANGNLSLTGGSLNITGDCTASGTLTDSGSPSCGTSGGGRPSIAVPPVSAITHKPLATYILKNNGTMTNQAGTVICNASSDNDACKTAGYGWKYEGSGNWTADSDGFFNAAYYVEGDAKISGNPGAPGPPTSNLWAVSIIAEGNIEISGNPDLRPFLPELLFVTNKDLKIGGNLGQPTSIEGQILVREQLMISGNPTLAGQIIVENVTSVSTLVELNTISGNPTIVYNGLVGSNTFEVTSWREVR